MDSESIEAKVARLDERCEQLAETVRNISRAAWGAIIGVGLLVLDFLRENVELVQAPPEGAIRLLVWLWRMVQV